MSKEIDYRVVEMRFDNKQFEAGAKTTMSTLSKLKEALKLPDTSKAFEDLDKASKNIKLDGIAAGIEALTNRFSTMGIVGMRVIENITDALMNKLHKAVSFVTDSIVSGGIKRAMNIENAHFQLQALLKDETKVQAIMANAMESVDGTAYAYDEAAKAASQFAASGVQAGDEMLNALKGITGVAAMTNSSFEDISRVFTTVAGNGRLMGDQLLQLSSRGLNAASTLAEYFREVRGQSNMTEAEIRKMVSAGQISFKDFSDAMTWAFGDSAKRANETFTGALSNMKSALARIGAGFISPLVEQNGELVQLFNALRIKINDVKSALVFDEQRSAISGLAEVTGMTNDELSEMFSTIKENGKLTIEDMDAFTRKGANATSALTKYINGVTNGSIRASYAIKTSLNELTNGTKVSAQQVRKFVEEGKIDLATFTSAMETEFGNEKTLSKQFTDWFQDHVHSIVEAINQADMTKPMVIFYYWVESIKNLVKGLLSVLKPVGKAFSDVFLSFNIDDVINFSSAVERLTSKLKLSEEGSKNLHDAFKGVFDVGKLLLDIFIKLLSAIIPINKPIVEMGGGLLSLVGFVGRVLTKFTEMIRSCELLKRAFGLISTGTSLAMDGLAKLIKIGKDFIGTISKLEGTKKLINAIGNAFERLGNKVAPHLKNFINEAESLFKSLFKVGDFNIDGLLGNISKAFEKLALDIENFSFQTVINAFDTLKEKIKNLEDLAMSNEGVNTFVTNMKKFFEDLKEAFTLDNLLDRIKNVMDVFGKFFNWIKDTMAPAFEDFNIGSAVAATGGFGIIYAMIKAAKSIEKLSDSLSSVPNILKSVSSTLEVYQKKLKAEALIKTAGAIAILAGALVLLSFADTDRILSASVALSVIAGTLMFSITKFIEAINKGKELNNAMSTLSKGLSSTMKKFGRAVEIKAIGSAVKKFAESIFIITASIIALGLMYRKDKDALMAGVELVKYIGIAMVAVMVGMSVFSDILKGGGVKQFLVAALGVLSLSAALGMIITALQKLFKMQFPPDWKFKMTILAAMLGGLGVLAIAMGVASRISGGNKLAASMILSMAALLITTIFALDRLFKMELPLDWEEKVVILGLIFASFGALMITIGIASRLAGGSMKAAGTILSMCLFLAVVVGSLMVLTIIPANKLMKGTTALGAILIMLGVSLASAAKVSNKNTYKSIIAMTTNIGVITASLAVLSMIPGNKLMKGAVALGSILLILAQDFKQVSKITNKKGALAGILGMMAIIAEVTYSLYILANQPWSGLLAGAASLSAVILAMSACFQMILEKNWSNNNIKKIGVFLLMTTALIPITVELAILANQPWSGLLAGAASLSAVILAMSACFQMILEKNWSNNNVKKIGVFLLMTTALIPITVELAILADQPWSGLLAGATALSGVLLGMSVAFQIISNVHPDIKSITMFGVSMGLVSALVAGELYLLSQQPWEGLIGAASALSLVLISMSACLAILTAIGTNITTATQAALGLSSFIGILGLVMTTFGVLFTEIAGLESYLDKGIEILIKIGNGLGSFAGAIIGGLIGEISSSLPIIATNLSKFYENGKSFFDGMATINESTFTNMGLLAGALLKLTLAELVNGLANLLGSNIAEVGTKLTDFMNNAKGFFDGVQNLKSESMEGAKKVAEMILAITKSDVIAGIGRIFGLGNNLEEFGKQLTAFGPHIKEFADQVKDVKPEAVEGAASAAEIMANLARKLPGTGGLVNKIFGEKSLAEFGEELVKFGPAISTFADQVKDVKPEAVEGAASAAEIMANVADKLPESGGLVNKIFGEKSLAEFGEELVSFGPSIAQFSEDVKNINASAVDGVALITTIMSDLANNLPSSDTLWQKIFGGGKVSLSEFGEELAKFGTSMSKFSDSVSGIDTNQVTNAITSFKDLIDLTTYVKGKTATELTTFASSLSKVGSDSIDKFVTAFNDGGSKVTTAISNIYTAATNTILLGGTALQVNYATSAQNAVQGFINAINNKKTTATTAISAFSLAVINQFKTSLPQTTFNTIGQNTIQGIIAGMIFKSSIISTSIGTVCTSITTNFTNGLSSAKFITIGQNIIDWMIQGLNSKIDTATFCNGIINSFKTGLSKEIFKEIGKNVSTGLEEGIKSQINAVSNASLLAANAAVEAVRKALKVRSPSRVLAEIGGYFSLGFADGIIDKVSIISNASEKAADEAIEPIKDAVFAIMDIIDREDFDIDPTIRPVVDLSDVHDGVKEIGSLMNKTYDLSVVKDLASSTSSSFNTSRVSKSNEKLNNDNGNTGDTYEFNQYNYSPKALNRSEIYRQTNNQFSAFRRAVNPKT